MNSCMKNFSRRIWMSCISGNVKIHQVIHGSVGLIELLVCSKLSTEQFNRVITSMLLRLQKFLLLHRARERNMLKLSESGSKIGKKCDHLFPSLIIVVKYVVPRYLITRRCY